MISGEWLWLEELYIKSFVFLEFCDFICLIKRKKFPLNDCLTWVSIGDSASHCADFSTLKQRLASRVPNSGGNDDAEEISLVS